MVKVLRHVTPDTFVFRPGAAVSLAGTSQIAAPNRAAPTWASIVQPNVFSCGAIASNKSLSIKRSGARSLNHRPGQDATPESKREICDDMREPSSWASCSTGPFAPRAQTRNPARRRRRAYARPVDHSHRHPRERHKRARTETRPQPNRLRFDSRNRIRVRWSRHQDTTGTRDLRRSIR